MHYQHHSAQIVHKDDERIENDDLVPRQKLLAREPELPEKYVFILCFIPTHIYINLVRLHAK
jgi:hypothetical protein